MNESCLILTCYSAYSDSVLKAQMQKVGATAVYILLVEKYLETASDPKRNYLLCVYSDLAKRVKRITHHSKTIRMGDIKSIKRQHIFCYK